MDPSATFKVAYWGDHDHDHEKVRLSHSLAIYSSTFVLIANYFWQENKKSGLPYAIKRSMRAIMSVNPNVQPLQLVKKVSCESICMHTYPSLIISFCRVCIY